MASTSASSNSLNWHLLVCLRLLPSTACSKSTHTMCIWIAISIHRFIAASSNPMHEFEKPLNNIYQQLFTDAPAVFWKKMVIFPQSSTVGPGARRLFTSTPLLSLGAPRLFSSKPRCTSVHHQTSSVLSDFSPALPGAPAAHCIGSVDSGIWPPWDSCPTTPKHSLRLPVTKYILLMWLGQNYVPQTGLQIKGPDGQDN